MKTNRYGYEGVDFTGGVSISDKEVKGWIDRITKSYDREKDSVNGYIASGDTAVFAEVMNGLEGKEIRFHVCKGYFDFRVPIKND
jgi:hypothetical protein